MSDSTPKIRAAREDEGPALSRLARAAKAHWGYAEELLDSWAAELTFDAALFARAWIRVAEEGGVVLGVLALTGSGAEREIEHLWVEPSAHGRGVGRALVEAAVRAAREQGVRRIRIDSDPNAVAFYERVGAKRIGSVASSVPGRELPVLELDLETQ